MLSKRHTSKNGKKGKWLELLAPGTARVRNFAIPVKLHPQKNGICIDWEGFLNSPEVQEQLKAASKLDLRSVSEEKESSAASNNERPAP